MLKQNVISSDVCTEDLLYNFFSQLITHTELTTFDDTFKSMVKSAIYEEYDNTRQRETASRIVKRFCIDLPEPWPEKFISGPIPRIFLADIRNQIVFVLWSQHKHMVDTKWLPHTNPSDNEQQNVDYKKAAHTFGGRMLDPLDIERLHKLLTWTHYIKMILFVKHHIRDEADMPIELLNTCSGSWLHQYNKHGMGSLIWEQFLDVWYYDNY